MFRYLKQLNKISLCIARLSNKILYYLNIFYKGVILHTNLK